MAYNWGARGRAAGLSALELLPLAAWPPMLGLTVSELDSLSRLGPEAWDRWALRGWYESSPSGELN